MAAASPQVSRITGGTPLHVAKHGCITICAAISIVATILLPDYTNKDIALEAQYGNV